MDIDNKVKYLEDRIKELVSYAKDAEIDYVEPCYYGFDEQIHCGNNETDQIFAHLTESIYYHVVAYLDFHKLDNYLELFYQTFGDNPKKAVKMGTFLDIFTGEIHSLFLVKIEDFLSCFPFMGKQFHYSDILYLERILKNTAAIIEQNKKLLGIDYPTKEPEIYKAIKVTLSSIFPDSKNPTSNFIKTAKCYKPDILIPELRTAIEYKFATNEKKLTNTIDEVVIDAKRYTGDINYNRFYAVFYVTSDFWGEDRFRKTWSESEIPKNWKAFYIVGKGSENN